MPGTEGLDCNCQPVIQQPGPEGIDIEKATNGEDADDPPGPTLAEDAPVNWTYVVTNTGVQMLTNIAVTDDQGVAVSCPPATSLVPGASMTCTATGDVRAGQYANVGTATATTSGGDEVSDSDPSHYFGGVGVAQGCTPGYWKQPHHFDSWPDPFAPDSLFSDVFEDAFPSKTLRQVLTGRGGGLNALGRHTVAALLNAAAGEVSFGLPLSEVIDRFNDVFPGTKDEYNELKDSFEALNEQGCPLH